MVNRCPHCHKIISTNSTKYTPLQIEKCIEYIKQGLGVSEIVRKLGPDWTRSNVYYYKNKHNM